MEPAHENATEYELHVATAVASYHQALDAGEPVDRQQWLDLYPETNGRVERGTA